MPNIEYPYLFAEGRGKLEIIRCESRSGWTYPLDGSIYIIKLIWDGIDYGIKEAARWLPAIWNVPDGTVSVQLIKTSDGTYLHTSGALNLSCPINPIMDVVAPTGVGGVPIITYLKVSDLGDGRAWLEYGVQGKGNIEIKIDSIIVQVFNNPYDNYSYGHAIPVSLGTHEVCVNGVS